MNKVDSEVVKSPCVSICALNEDDICVGCYRTGVEISLWGGMSANEKRDVIGLVKKREMASYIG